MNKKNYWSFIIGWGISIFIFLISGCSHPPKVAVSDSPTSGTINISVDESFKPVIEDEIKVYEASNPGTKIIAHYKAEAECFKDLFLDSANRMVIVTRGLSLKEGRFYNDSLGFSPISDRIAWDAITIIVNNKSADTLFTREQLKMQLNGKLKTNEQFVFDGLNETSTVRFAIDSILRGDKFDTSVVKAVKSSAEVLKYVSENDDAIGMVGINWIGNPEDTVQVNLLKKVNICYVKCDYCADSPYIKPTQASILTKRYPLVRGLYYILKENYNGLGSGFVAFMKNDRGQLIFNRAYLAPIMNFQIRSVKINEKL